MNNFVVLVCSKYCMRKLCINVRLNTKSNNIVTPSTKKKTLHCLSAIQMYLKFKFSRNLNSRGHGVRTEHCWRAGPSGQDLLLSDKLLLFASIYRQARWHARLSWTAPAKHRLVASLYFAFLHSVDTAILIFPLSLQHCPPYISTHYQNVFQVPSL